MTRPNVAQSRVLLLSECDLQAGVTSTEFLGLAEEMVTAIDHSTEFRRVLFVDDSRLMRYAGYKFLNGYCDLAVAEDGHQAWNQLKRDETIKMVFTDLLMPVMDGHELIRLIRTSRDPRLREIPVLVVTSQEEDGARELAISEGATDFIPKPFSPDDLRHALVALDEQNQPGLRPETDTDRLSIHELVQAQGAEPETFLFRLHQALSFHQRQQLDITLLHLQLQSFWQTRNQYGQAWADAVMRNVHRVLVHELRDEDAVHRTAPDLFSIILMGTDRTGARVLTRRIRNRLSGSSMRLANRSVRIDLSYALQFPDVNADEDPAELLESAMQLLRWRTASSTHTDSADVS